MKILEVLKIKILQILPPAKILSKDSAKSQSLMKE